MIPPNVFKEFSISQLQYFNAEQIAAITMQQKAALSTSQRNVITKTEDETEKTNSGKWPRSIQKLKVNVNTTCIVSNHFGFFLIKVAMGYLEFH